MSLDKVAIKTAILDYMEKNGVTVKTTGQDKFNQYALANVYNIFTHLLSLGLVKPEMEASFVSACELSYNNYVVSRIIGL